jgi:hypothetical protein
LLLAAIDWRTANQPAREGSPVTLILGRPFDPGLRPAFCIAECDAINFRTDANEISSRLPLKHSLETFLETFPCLDIGREVGFIEQTVNNKQ